MSKKALEALLFIERNVDYEHSRLIEGKLDIIKHALEEAEKVKKEIDRLYKSHLKHINNYDGGYLAALHTVLDVLKGVENES